VQLQNGNTATRDGVTHRAFEVLIPSYSQHARRRGQAHPKSNREQQQVGLLVQQHVEMRRLLLPDEGPRGLDDPERRLRESDSDAKRTGHTEQGGQREREWELAPEAFAHGHETVEEPKGEEGEANDGKREPQEDFQGVVDTLTHRKYLRARRWHQAGARWVK
jgi:hypothetical protein